MTIKLYYDFLSQPSRALYIFLKKTEIQFEEKIISLAGLEHKTLEFQQVNPFQKVPCIEHNGFKLTESIAIVRYLSREYDIPRNWYPTSSQDQARVDEYLEWQHLNTRMHCSAFFLLKYLNPLIRGQPPDPEKLKPYEGRMVKCLDIIENVWLEKNKFLAGDRISVADLFGACEIEQPKMAGYDARRGRPRLTAWLTRVAEETSPHYQLAHQQLNEIANQSENQMSSKL